jgi:hypothetical protein
VCASQECDTPLQLAQTETPDVAGAGRARCKALLQKHLAAQA